MKGTVIGFFYSILFLGVLISSICSCSRPPRQIGKIAVATSRPVRVNIYIENSGSMKGYFTGNSQIKDIIKEYYDRISENQKSSDAITLNFINTQIENYGDDIKSFLVNAQSKCNASYTNVDDILSFAMEGCDDSTVNIVISDYCFESNDGSLAMAASGVTKIFSEQMKTNSDLSVAIIKYMSDFKGKYFPGGIICNKPLPFYIWIFGNGKDVKKIANLPVSNNCGKLLLQPHQFINHKLLSKKARMIEGDAIIVKEWDKKRSRGSSCSNPDDSDDYVVKFEVDLSSVILPEEDIVDGKNYIISEGYEINFINRNQEDKYVFTISTHHPSPGILKIDYAMDKLPQWVEKSNFSGKGIPDDSTTLGIKDLIKGVYDAYHNTSNEYFSIRITLK